MDTVKVKLLDGNYLLSYDDQLLDHNKGTFLNIHFTDPKWQGKSMPPVKYYVKEFELILELIRFGTICIPESKYFNIIKTKLEVYPEVNIITIKI